MAEREECSERLRWHGIDMCWLLEMHDNSRLLADHLTDDPIYYGY